MVCQFITARCYAGTRKATNVKFCRYIYGVHPSESPLKISEKKDRRRIQGLPNFGGTPYYLRNG